MEYRYIPVQPSADVCTHRWNNPTPVCHLEEACRSWGAEAYFVGLMSYAAWGRVQFPHPYPEDAFLVGDSGGHTVMSTGKMFSPEDVLRWQAQFMHMGFMLDIPPYLDRRPHHGNRAGPSALGWRRGLHLSVENVRRALPEYQEERAKGSPFRWWGVLQGRTEGELARWWEAVSGAYPFVDPGEGWGFNAAGNTPERLAFVMGVLHRLGIRRVHALGVSGWRAMGTLIGLGLLGGFELVMWDSASSFHLAVNRTIMWSGENPYVLRQIREWDRKGPYSATGLMMKCPCASCRAMRDDFPDGPPRTRYLTHRMHMHSLLLYRRAADALYREAEDDPEQFLRRLLTPEEGPGRGKKTRSPSHQFPAMLRAFAGQVRESKSILGHRSLLEWV